MRLFLKSVVFWVLVFIFSYAPLAFAQQSNYIYNSVHDSSLNRHTLAIRVAPYAHGFIMGVLDFELFGDSATELDLVFLEEANENMVYRRRLDFPGYTFSAVTDLLPLPSGKALMITTHREESTGQYFVATIMVSGDSLDYEIIDTLHIDGNFHYHAPFKMHSSGESFYSLMQTGYRNPDTGGREFFGVSFFMVGEDGMIEKVSPLPPNIRIFDYARITQIDDTDEYFSVLNDEEGGFLGYNRTILNEEGEIIDVSSSDIPNIFREQTFDCRYRNEPDDVICLLDANENDHYAITKVTYDLDSLGNEPSIDSAFGYELSRNLNFLESTHTTDGEVFVATSDFAFVPDNNITPNIFYLHTYNSDYELIDTLALRLGDELLVRDMAVNGNDVIVIGDRASASHLGEIQGYYLYFENITTSTTEVSDQQEQEIIVAPNPIHSGGSIRLIHNEGNRLAGEYQYRLFDVIGREWQSGTVNSDNYTIATDQLSTGMYFIILINKHSERISLKVQVY